MEKHALQSPIKVWYKSLPGSSKILWPIVDVRLQNKEIVLPQPILSLVDSGANQSILHPLVAKNSWV